jgi:hypothetical protein
MAAWHRWRFGGSTVARPGRITLSVALKRSNHCGSWANDAAQLKLCYVKLPETLQKVMAQKYGPG